MIALVWLLVSVIGYLCVARLFYHELTRRNMGEERDQCTRHRNYNGQSYCLENECPGRPVNVRDSRWNRLGMAYLWPIMTAMLSCRITGRLICRFVTGKALTVPEVQEKRKNLERDIANAEAKLKEATAAVKKATA